MPSSASEELPFPASSSVEEPSASDEPSSVVTEGSSAADASVEALRSTARVPTAVSAAPPPAGQPTEAQAQAARRRHSLLPLDVLPSGRHSGMPNPNLERQPVLVTNASASSEEEERPLSRGSSGEQEGVVPPVRAVWGVQQRSPSALPPPLPRQEHDDLLDRLKRAMVVAQLEEAGGQQAVKDLREELVRLRPTQLQGKVDEEASARLVQLLDDLGTQYARARRAGDRLVDLRAAHRMLEGPLTHEVQAVRSATVAALALLQAAEASPVTAEVLAQVAALEALSTKAWEFGATLQRSGNDDAKGLGLNVSQNVGAGAALAEELRQAMASAAETHQDDRRVAHAVFVAHEATVFLLDTFMRAALHQPTTRREAAAQNLAATRAFQQEALPSLDALQALLTQAACLDLAASRLPTPTPERLAAVRHASASYERTYTNYFDTAWGDEGATQALDEPERLALETLVSQQVAALRTLATEHLLPCVEAALTDLRAVCDVPLEARTRAQVDPVVRRVAHALSSASHVSSWLAALAPQAFHGWAGDTLIALQAVDGQLYELASLALQLAEEECADGRKLLAEAMQAQGPALSPEAALGTGRAAALLSGLRAAVDAVSEAAASAEDRCSIARAALASLPPHVEEEVLAQQRCAAEVAALARDVQDAEQACAGAPMLATLERVASYFEGLLREAAAGAGIAGNVGAQVRVDLLQAAVARGDLQERAQALRLAVTQVTAGVGSRQALRSALRHAVAAGRALDPFQLGAWSDRAGSQDGGPAAAAFSMTQLGASVAGGGADAWAEYVLTQGGEASQEAGSTREGLAAALRVVHLGVSSPSATRARRSGELAGDVERDPRVLTTKEGVQRVLLVAEQLGAEEELAAAAANTVLAAVGAVEDEASVAAEVEDALGGEGAAATDVARALARALATSPLARLEGALRSILLRKDEDPLAATTSRMVADLVATALRVASQRRRFKQAWLQQPNAPSEPAALRSAEAVNRGRAWLRAHALWYKSARSRVEALHAAKADALAVSAAATTPTCATAAAAPAPEAALLCEAKAAFYRAWQASTEDKSTGANRNDLRQVDEVRARFAAHSAKTRSAVSDMDAAVAKVPPPLSVLPANEQFNANAASAAAEEVDDAGYGKAQELTMLIEGAYHEAERAHAGAQEVLAKHAALTHLLEAQHEELEDLTRAKVEAQGRMLQALRTVTPRLEAFRKRAEAQRLGVLQEGARRVLEVDPSSFTSVVPGPEQPGERRLAVRKAMAVLLAAASDSRASARDAVQRAMAPLVNTLQVGLKVAATTLQVGVQAAAHAATTLHLPALSGVDQLRRSVAEPEAASSVQQHRGRRRDEPRAGSVANTLPVVNTLRNPANTLRNPANTLRNPANTLRNPAPTPTPATPYYARVGQALASGMDSLRRSVSPSAARARSLTPPQPPRTGSVARGLPPAPTPAPLVLSAPPPASAQPRAGSVVAPAAPYYARVGQALASGMDSLRRSVSPAAARARSLTPTQPPRAGSVASGLPAPTPALVLSAPPPASAQPRAGSVVAPAAPYYARVGQALASGVDSLRRSVSPSAARARSLTPPQPPRTGSVASGLAPPVRRRLSPFSAPPRPSAQPRAGSVANTPRTPATTPVPAAPYYARVGQALASGVDSLRRSVSPLAARARSLTPAQPPRAGSVANSLPKPAAPLTPMPRGRRGEMVARGVRNAFTAVSPAAVAATVASVSRGVGAALVGVKRSLTPQPRASPSPRTVAGEQPPPPSAPWFGRSASPTAAPPRAAAAAPWFGRSASPNAAPAPLEPLPVDAPSRSDFQALRDRAHFGERYLALQREWQVVAATPSASKRESKRAKVLARLTEFSTSIMTAVLGKANVAGEPRYRVACQLAYDFLEEATRGPTLDREAFYTRFLARSRALRNRGPRTP